MYQNRYLLHNYNTSEELSMFIVLVMVGQTQNSTTYKYKDMYLSSCKISSEAKEILTNILFSLDWFEYPTFPVYCTHDAHWIFHGLTPWTKAKVAYF